MRDTTRARAGDAPATVVRRARAAPSDEHGEHRHAVAVDPEIKARNVRRLRRIEGQVRGLQKMVDEDRYCADIMTQISSVHEALRSVGRELMRNHLKHCASTAIRRGRRQGGRDVRRAARAHVQARAVMMHSIVRLVSCARLARRVRARRRIGRAPRGAGPRTDRLLQHRAPAGRSASRTRCPIEYRGVELHLAPLRWESARNATYRWSLEPEVAVGMFPRTQLQIGVPFAFVDRRTSSAHAASPASRSSALHALNAETSIPALALAADVLLPVGVTRPRRARTAR